MKRQVGLNQPDGFNTQTDQLLIGPEGVAGTMRQGSEHWRTLG